MFTARYALSPYITQTCFVLTGLRQFVITRSLPLESVQQIKTITIFTSELKTSNRLYVNLGYHCGLNKAPRSYGCHAVQTDTHGRFGTSYRSHLQGCVTSQKSEDQTEQLYRRIKIDSETACPILRSQTRPV